MTTRLAALVCRYGAALYLAAAGAGPIWALPVAAATGAPELGASWASLTPAQHSALAPLRPEWASLEAESKKKWLEVASRFPAMSADERARVQVRMADWVRLSPAERGRARLQFQETRQLSPEDRQARWEAYKALPPAERNALAAKAVPDQAGRSPARQLDAASAAGSAKRNVVTASPVPPPRAPVAPTVVQANPGATTTLMSKPVSPPIHHQPGLPKIAATKGFVDPSTLLPKRGPQGAAMAAAPLASAAGSKQP